MHSLRWSRFTDVSSNDNPAPGAQRGVLHPPQSPRGSGEGGGSKQSWVKWCRMGPPKIAFSWDISISGWILWFIVDIAIVFMGFISQQTELGGPILWGSRGMCGKMGSSWSEGRCPEEKEHIFGADVCAPVPSGKLTLLWKNGSIYKWFAHWR